MVVDLTAYKERVWQLAEKRDGEAIYNGSPEHAAVIVERLFATAEHHVRLLTGDLEAKVYAETEVIQSATRFLAHGDHKLDVLVEDDSFSRFHPFWVAVGACENAQFYHAPQELSELIPYHFMTADDKSFRFERDKNTHTAVAAFGDAVVTTNLNGIFDSLKARCDILEHATA